MELYSKDHRELEYINYYMMATFAFVGRRQGYEENLRELGAVREDHHDDAGLVWVGSDGEEDGDHVLEILEVSSFWLRMQTSIVTVVSFFRILSDLHRTGKGSRECFALDVAVDVGNCSNNCPSKPILALLNSPFSLLTTLTNTSSVSVSFTAWFPTAIRPETPVASDPVFRPPSLFPSTNAPSQSGIPSSFQFEPPHHLPMWPVAGKLQKMRVWGWVGAHSFLPCRLLRYSCPSRVASSHSRRAFGDSGSNANWKEGETSKETREPKTSGNDVDFPRVVCTLLQENFASFHSVLTGSRACVV